MYGSEREKVVARDFGGDFDAVSAGEVFGRHILGAETDHLRELDKADRDRIFNLGYFTWVEQQGVPLEDFDRRKDRCFWQDLVDSIPAWDRLIEDFNAEVGAGRVH